MNPMHGSNGHSIHVASTLLLGLFLLVLGASILFALVLLVTDVVPLRPFRRRGYGRPSVTLREGVVRGRSMKVVADWFFHTGIGCVCEWPAFVRNGSAVSRPDFYPPDYDVYVE